MESFFNDYHPEAGVPYYPGDIMLDFDRRRMIVKFFTDINRALAPYGSGHNTFAFYDIYTTCTTGTLHSTWRLARQRGKLCPTSRVSKNWLTKPSIYPSPALSMRGAHMKHGSITYFESYQSEPYDTVDVPTYGMESSCTN